MHKQYQRMLEELFHDENFVNDMILHEEMMGIIPIKKILEAQKKYQKAPQQYSGSQQLTQANSQECSDKDRGQ